MIIHFILSSFIRFANSVVAIYARARAHVSQIWQPPRAKALIFKFAACDNNFDAMLIKVKQNILFAPKTYRVKQRIFAVIKAERPACKLMFCSRRQHTDNEIKRKFGDLPVR